MNTFLFFALLLILTIGPGLYAWSKIRLSTENPFLAPTVVLGTSLGATIFCTWVLYLLGLYSPISLLGMVAVFTIALGRGAYLLCRDFSVPRGEPRMSWTTRVERGTDWLLFLVACAFVLGMAKCLWGHPFQSWDAVVSWDKWAVDISQRRGLFGYVSGGYPPGIPLFLSVFYAFFLPEGVLPLSSFPGLALPAVMQVFPLLLSVSLLSACRSMIIPSAVSFLLVFGNAAFVHAMMKQVGYVDVPLAAFLVAAVAWGCAPENEASANDRRSRFVSSAISFLLLFAVSFIKGNGFVLLGLALGLGILLDRKRGRNLWYAAILALLAAGVFYLHQCCVGVWFPSWAETSPFNHALSVRSSHSYLVKPGLSDVLKKMDAWSGFYQVPAGPFSRVAIGGALGLLVAGLFSQTLRMPSLLFLVVVAALYRTSSYDWRNTLSIVGLLALLLPWIVCRGARHLSNSILSYPILRLLCLGVSLGVCGWLMKQNRFLEMAEWAFHSPPRGKPFVVWNPLEKTGLEERAEHMYMAATEYRSFAKGVYTLQQNAPRSEVAHDLAFSNAIYTPPSSFVPIAELSHCTFGSRLYLCRPAEIPADIEMLSVEETEGGGERRVFRLVPGMADATTSGVLELRVNPANVVSLRSENEARAFLPYSGKDVVRLPYECKRHEEIRFTLETRAPLSNEIEALVLY